MYLGIVQLPVSPRFHIRPESMLWRDTPPGRVAKSITLTIAQ